MTRESLIEERAIALRKEESNILWVDTDEWTKKRLIYDATADVDWFLSHGLVRLAEEQEVPDCPFDTPLAALSDKQRMTGWYECIDVIKAAGFKRVERDG